MADRLLRISDYLERHVRWDTPSKYELADAYLNEWRSRVRTTPTHHYAKNPGDLVSAGEEDQRQFRIQCERRWLAYLSEVGP